MPMPVPTPTKQVPTMTQRQAKEFFKMVELLQDEIRQDFEMFFAVLQSDYNPMAVGVRIGDCLRQSVDDLVRRTDIIQDYLEPFFDDDVLMWD